MPSPSHQRAVALAVLAAGSAALSFTSVFMRLSHLGPIGAGFWRFVFALPLLSLPLLVPAVRRSSAASGFHRPSPLLMLAAVFFALNISFWHTGLTLTSLANSTTIANLSQVFVVVGAWWLYRERPRPVFLLGLALALVGVWAMAASRKGATGSDPLLGDLMSMGAAVWYAGYILSVRRARQAAGVLTVMLWTTLIGTPLLLLGALAMHEQLTPATTAAWGACLGMAVAHCLGQGAIAWALGKLPASLAAVVILINPVVTALLALAIFGEGLSLVQIVGGLLALSGVLMAQLAGVRPGKIGAQTSLQGAAEKPAP